MFLRRSVTRTTNPLSNAHAHRMTGNKPSRVLHKVFWTVLRYGRICGNAQTNGTPRNSIAGRHRHQYGRPYGTLEVNKTGRYTQRRGSTVTFSRCTLFSFTLVGVQFVSCQLLLSRIPPSPQDRFFGIYCRLKTGSGSTLFIVRCNVWIRFLDVGNSLFKPFNCRL